MRCTSIVFLVMLCQLAVSGCGLLRRRIVLLVSPSALGNDFFSLKYLQLVNAVCCFTAIISDRFGCWWACWEAVFIV